MITSSDEDFSDSDIPNLEEDDEIEEQERVPKKIKISNHQIISEQPSSSPFSSGSSSEEQNMSLAKVRPRVVKQETSSHLYFSLEFVWKGN